MKRTHKLLALTLAAGVLSFLQACQKDDGFISRSTVDLKNGQAFVNNANPERTFYSSARHIGNGRAQAWVTENREGEPVSVGLTLSAGALTNLPDEMTGFVLELPKGKGKNFYTFVMLDWNPQGHEPPQIYGLPHFDVHFYIVPDEVRLGMLPEKVTEFENLPSDEYVPAGYFRGPGFVPFMGVHWLNGASHELHGATFTQTFIWGSYDGEFVFWEPMLTRDYLLTRPNEVIGIPQPAAYKRDGWYPTRYEISWSKYGNDYTIALRDLQFRQGQ
ncbi:MAG TPA: DUF5602 domain-containing protein [Bacteroidales bacterium]|nr:DUF5602 domain-containing protein [Bacteroidales bacterium]HOC47986.1 DUF5602 domain-containing protein [Bacteroidales bacterium]HPS97433.1 DUF5602 domain-containing protein [Bacteroidales bacterium]